MAASRSTPAAAAGGIACLPLPTPLPVGDVNAYLVDGDPLVLVDCGPAWVTTLVALEAALAAVGRAVEDVGLLVLTHHHPDHFGLAAEVVRRSGATVAAAASTVAPLADWEAWSRRADGLVCDGMVRHGVPTAVAEALRDAGPTTRQWASSVRVDRPLRDGDVLELGGRPHVVAERPGHSESDLLLVDHAARTAIGGDHLLAGISSNALVAPPLRASGTGRPRALLQYRRSLRATRALELDVVLPGHGPPVTGLRALIDERLAAQEHRARTFLGLLEDGPASAHDLAVARWGAVALRQPYATLSEVLGHLDLLVEDGRAVEDREGAIVRFARR